MTSKAQLLSRLAFAACFEFPALVVGTSPTVTAANLAKIMAAMDRVSSNFGGGTIILPPGLFDFSDQITIGDGSNAQQSTKHHNIRIVGAGAASSDEVSNTQVRAVTTLRYAGAADPAKSVIELAGPLHGVKLEDFEADAAGLAGIGLKTTHVDSFVYRNIIVRRWTVNNYVFTTRNGFPVGVAHGCSNGSLYDCHAYLPASNAASGILLTSGVPSGTTLIGNPDTANVDIHGGVFFYGGSTGTAGIEFAGCDNNSYHGSQFLPKGGNDGGGKSHKWTQWPGSPAFPLGNHCILGGFTQGMTGTAGTAGNYARYDTSDSGYVANIAGLNAELLDGRRIVNGQRVYSVHSVATAELNSSTQSTTNAAMTDIPGMSIPLTYPAGSKLRLSFSGLVTKATTGTGDFMLHFNGTDYGQTRARVLSNGAFNSIAMELLLDLPAAGAALNAKARFASDGANQVQINSGVLVAEVLY